MWIKAQYADTITTLEVGLASEDVVAAAVIVVVVVVVVRSSSSSV